MSQSNAETVEKLGHLAGKYLTFALGREQYGVQILKVIEIIGMMHITRVPRCPSHTKGIINLRGKIIPIIDLRSKFGMSSIPHDEKTCIIIGKVMVNNSPVALGMIVDTVLEVVDLHSSKIEPPPDYGVTLESRFLLGLGRTKDDQVTILIDLDKVLSEIDSTMVASLAAEAPVAEAAH